MDGSCFEDIYLVIKQNFISPLSLRLDMLVSENV